MVAHARWFVALLAIGMGCSQGEARVDEQSPDAGTEVTVDAAPPFDVPTAQAVTLKVGTFNILHGFPTGENLEQRTDIVVNWINTEKPDLMALQEAAQSSGMQNRGDIIAQRTGYHWVWTKAAGFAGVFEEGPGVLSRLPIAASEGVMLPHVVNTFGVRVATRAVVETPAGRVAIVSAHIGGDDPPETVINQDQATAAHNFLMAAPSSTFHILAGDMNASATEPGMVFLRSKLDDAWLKANPTQPGFTADAASPTERIDYVYVESSMNVQSCKLLFDQPVNGLYASDHLGVLCEVRIGGSPTM
jgi:endonuclease/exonuclease/phosphatase family metal-dependent hydrolase